MVRQGKVLYVGISDAPAWWVAQANTLAELRGWTQFIGLQIEYSAHVALNAQVVP
jgi:aryl-alcohol dehydrogenase-like predicted oxidoreductase